MWWKKKGSRTVEERVTENENGPTHLKQLKANYTSLESATH